MGRFERRSWRRRERRVPKYRLKILCEIPMSIRDDAEARQMATFILTAMNIQDQRIASAHSQFARPVTVTLVCEGAKDGRNLLPPASSP